MSATTSTATAREPRAPKRLPRVVVVMGVAGVGKTTVGRRVAAALDLPFLDADDFHPATNLQKMAAGQPLDDADRAPWLEALAAALARAEPGGGAVLACSALKASYRRHLGSRTRTAPRFVHLSADRELLALRLTQRGGHFLPPSLLDSQLETLEPPTDALTFEASTPLEPLCDAIVAALAGDPQAGAV